MWLFKIIISFLFLNIFLSETLLSQNSLDVEFEIQAYPTGLIPGLRLEKNYGNKQSLHIRLGYNWIRHRDLGKHDDERGNGYGLTLGYKRYFADSHKGWNMGLKSDLWMNRIDWIQGEDINNPARSGTTDITVIQPTIELSYLYDMEKFIFTPSISFGYEWNIHTEGEPTGDGPILLIGIQVGRRYLSNK